MFLQQYSVAYVRDVLTLDAVVAFGEYAFPIRLVGLMIFRLLAINSVRSQFVHSPIPPYTECAICRPRATGSLPLLS